MRKADNLPPYCAVVKKCRSLNFLDPSGPARPVTGVLYLYCFMIAKASRIVGTCRASATIQLAISVPEVSVLWNFGVYSFRVVHHI